MNAEYNDNGKSRIDPKSLTDFMTVDPGTTTAVVYWENGNVHSYDSFHSKLSRLEKYLDDMMLDFRNILRYHLPELVYIEGVEVWGTSLKSVSAATSGKLQKLSYLVGAYTGVCSDVGPPFEIIPPSRWKGQLPDDAVKSRVHRALGRDFPNIHITCAVGMGLSLMNKL